MFENAKGASLWQRRHCSDLPTAALTAPRAIWVCPLGTLCIDYPLSNNINYISPPGNMGLPIGHTIHIYSSNLLDICPVSMGFPRLISHQGVAWLGGECLLLPSVTWLTPKKLFSSLIRRAASRFEEVPAKAPSRIT